MGGLELVLALLLCYKTAMPKKKETIFVAMSGGVDSSVAAALLQKSGFHVVGVYMKCWTADDPLYKGCTSVDDERSARLAASHLGIPFYSWNFIKEYREKVVDYMIAGYKKGITPNPDIMCNKEIKFGLFYVKAKKLGADFVATGHYARILGGRLFQGKDKNKDQSYFLSSITPGVLKNVLFPIGEYTKPQVRELALKFGLPNAKRKDSQGICFIGKVDFEDFLKAHIPSHSGAIVELSGKKIGMHEGLNFYTIGQRKGIKLSGGPYYVVRKDFAKNELIVSKDEKDLHSKELNVEGLHWFNTIPELPLRVDAKIRYRTPSFEGTLEKEGNTYKLVFDQAQRAVTPGQFAVFYNGEELIGSGIIQ